MSQLDQLLNEAVKKVAMAANRRKELEAMAKSVERRETLRDQTASSNDQGDTEPEASTEPLE